MLPALSRPRTFAVCDPIVHVCRTLVPVPIDTNGPPSMLYAIIVGLPAGLEAVSVTCTGDTYQPFAPFVPPLLDVVTGGAWVPPPPLLPTSWSVIECATSRFPAWSVAKYSRR